jgi:hypothetical protein
MFSGILSSSSWDLTITQFENSLRMFSASKPISSDITTGTSAFEFRKTSPFHLPETLVPASKHLAVNAEIKGKMVFKQPLSPESR